jgi:hypothetical protein
MRVFRTIGLTVGGFVGGFVVAAIAAKSALPSRGGAESDELGLVAIFDGIQLESHATAFRGGTMLAWFGGIDADLRRAALAPDASLSLTSLFGGISLRVPEGWRIESTGRALWGGIMDDVPEPEDPAAPRLVLESVALFGGVAVRASSAADGAADA